MHLNLDGIFIGYYVIYLLCSKTSRWNNRISAVYWSVKLGGLPPIRRNGACCPRQPLPLGLLSWYLVVSLQWRHNLRDGVSNHQPYDCLRNRLFRRRSKKTSKLCVAGLCVGNSPVTGKFPAQRASNAENNSIWWRHHVYQVSATYLKTGQPYMKSMGVRSSIELQWLDLKYRAPGQ